ncbi:uncharacterized protein LOC131945149 isoform X1 [Physella acuta]|uniref:uncharacterized protein LOC131945149 isoform X1 n=1 Tax=Physella acuta TaxID=109671 RepID=UPI0027DDCF76|nr:uncharacterized protein LOC131945149 isoform X1 [Physella acuta]XP_059162141.1 uncharacterized protein LOC131945149 isoform X1 [Physella acuta]
MENTGGKKRENQLAEKGLTHRQDEKTQLEERQDETTQFEEKKTEGDFIPGHHEAEICYGGEADLHKHYTGCKKNPGHVNFIPVNDFNLDHLPSRYRDVIMLEVIKALSALTVLIKVKYTSLERPKSVPCFSGQYPFYNTRGSDVLRTGTGRVWCVYKYTESDNMGTCPCGKCQHSDTPSKVWGEVSVVTATHVVFDESEARQTRCVVGFDDNKSPVVSLDGWRVRASNIEGDWCWFTCVSCDLELVDELDKMCRHFDGLCKKVEDKYRRFVDVDKLAVIVSHPHGCPKQVSVGQWTHKRERESWYKYTYTTCTCPGSSGAHVYLPEYVRWWLHPHSGSNSEGNYSGEGGW